MCKNPVVDAKFEELETFINSLPSKDGALISVLHKAQEIFGYLPKEVQIFVAEKLGMPVSKVYGVITFYSFFTTEPRGEYVINVCLGTACFVRGAGPVLQEFEKELGIKVGETTPDNKFTVDTLRCVGACGLAPVVTVNNKVYGHVTPKDVKKILSEYNQ
ncbi:MAG: NAD(P)H-dependent oxidoreductase subunit E [Clostridiaceae bacterium]